MKKSGISLCLHVVLYTVWAVSLLLLFFPILPVSGVLLVVQGYVLRFYIGIGIFAGVTSVIVITETFLSSPHTRKIYGLPAQPDSEQGGTEPAVKKSKEVDLLSDSDPRHLLINLASTAFYNEDGVNRQDLISQLKPGERVKLIVEGEVDESPMVRVESKKGVVGYIPKAQAPNIAGQIYHHTVEKAYIMRVTGDGGKTKYGAILLIRVKEPTPDAGSTAPAQ